MESNMEVSREKREEVKLLSLQLHDLRLRLSRWVHCCCQSLQTGFHVIFLADCVSLCDNIWLLPTFLVPLFAIATQSFDNLPFGNFVLTVESVGLLRWLRVTKTWGGKRRWGIGRACRAIFPQVGWSDILQLRVCVQPLKSTDLDVSASSAGGIVGKQ